LIWDVFSFGLAGAGKIEFGEFVILKWLNLVAFTGYLAWKRAGVRIDWLPWATEFDTFADRRCSGDGLAI